MIDCIFVHIPRTAGTSVRKVLGMEGAAVHLTAQEWKEKYPKKWERSYKFTIVRNPYDRLVSYYAYRRASKESFSSFVKAVVGQNPEDLMKSQVQRLIINGRITLDGIFRFENIQYTWEYFAEKVGFPSVLPHENKSKNRGRWEDYYDEELKNLVYRGYQEDFVLLGYER